MNSLQKFMGNYKIKIIPHTCYSETTEYQNETARE